ncbi:MAG: tRNA (adenosine(37)-N6)-threonylcarbamoyltransferase complex dimerization subunit type 1 TsaB [Planctomycetota bacterium]
MARSNEKPLILTVETSGRFGSVAIAKGKEIKAEIAFQRPLQHSAEIFPTIQKILDNCKEKAKNLGHVYLSIGPGSFTGLRIAVTIAKIMHLTNNTKIISVDTLDVIAQNANEFESDKIAVILDAKRGQFFTGVYERTRNSESISPWQSVSPHSLMTASEFLAHYCESSEPIWLLGEGLVYYKEKFKGPAFNIFDDSLWYPKASNVHRLGWQLAQKGCFSDPAALVPNYMRKPDLKEK